MEVIEEQRPDSDAALIDECRSGNPAAFDELVRRYKDRVYNVVYRFLGNHEDAQDVAQEVFMRAHQAMEQFQGRARIYTWLYSIAANLARNRLRDSGRKGRDKGISLELLQGDRWMSKGRTPEDDARQRELDEALQEALSELAEPYRLVFVLRTFDDLSYAEIAEIAGCPKGTVKSRLNHARKELHARLKDMAVL